MITYNHEDYIVEAIERVLKQSVSFPMEFIIADDKSTDGTRTICENYARQYPDIIKLLPAEPNLGMMKNFLRAWRACSAKYIAFIEGDDYWTDPLKLQKQIDFLEANPEFSICFHNVTIKYNRNNSTGERVFHQKLAKDIFQTEDLLAPWFIPSGSVVFVNYPDLQLPGWFASCKSGDIPFLLLLSLKGKIKYLDEVMGVYRLHDSGVSVTHISYDKIVAMIFIYENFNIYTNFRFRETIRQAIKYEIDTHIPKTEVKSAGQNEDILIKVYKKLKNVFNN